MQENKITVTSPLLPDLKALEDILYDIWQKKWVTNEGEYHKRLEAELAKYLGVSYISLFTNGTLPLITILQEMRITGEVITTPYSFVATTHSLWWNGIKPVFVDVEESTGNLDPLKIEAAITPKTTAIMAVHVYGNPCNTEAIANIARKYGLKVIYDAAHAFGVKTTNDKSILLEGDAATLSFHATKVYNTLEGGAIVCHDKNTKAKLDRLRNFGYIDEVTVEEPGINAKLDEVRSAIGLLNLKQVELAIAHRKEIAMYYRQALDNIQGIRYIKDMQGVKHNYSYFPIFIDESLYGLSRDALYEKLKAHNIYARRYFYPLISDFAPYKSLESAAKSNLPIANKLANQVLCLPIYHDLCLKDAARVIDVIKQH